MGTPLGSARAMPAELEESDGPGDAPRKTTKQKIEERIVKIMSEDKKTAMTPKEIREHIHGHVAANTFLQHRKRH